MHIAQKLLRQGLPDQGFNRLPQDRGAVFDGTVFAECLLLADPMVFSAPAFGEHVMKNRQQTIQSESELCFRGLSILEVAPEPHNTLSLVLRKNRKKPVSSRLFTGCFPGIGCFIVNERVTS